MEQVDGTCFLKSTMSKVLKGSIQCDLIASLTYHLPTTSYVMLFSQSLITQSTWSLRIILPLQSKVEQHEVETVEKILEVEVVGESGGDRLVG